MPSPPAVVRGRRSVTHPSEIALLPLTGPPVPPDSIVRHRSRLRSVRVCVCVFSFVTVSSAGDLMACVASAGRLARPATCCACLRSFCWGCSMRSEVRRQKARLRACCVRCFALWCVPSLLQVSWRGGDTCPFVFVLFPCRQMLLLKSLPVVSLSYRCRQRPSLFLLSLASLLQVQSCGVVCAGRIEYRFGCFPWLRASARLRDWPAYLEARYSPPPVRGLGHSSSDANVRHRGYVPASLPPPPFPRPLWRWRGPPTVGEW